MAMRNCGTILKGSGKDLTVWKLEWTFGSSGAVTLDSTQSDEDPSIATPLTDEDTGIVSLRFPKCSRFWVLSKNLEPAGETTGTEYRFHEVTDKSASAGTAKVRFFNTTFAAADPTSGSRYQLILLLERP
jgi:hypothetical protein